MLHLSITIALYYDAVSGLMLDVKTRQVPL